MRELAMRVLLGVCAASIAAACGDVEAPNAVPAPDATDDAHFGELPCDIGPNEIEAIARTRAQAELEMLLGPYAGGEVRVYRGTASAKDNAGVLPGYQDGSLSGNVVAALWSTQVGRQPVHELWLLAPSVAKWFRVAQEGVGKGPVGVSPILDFGASGGGGAISAELVPSLAAAPPSLAFSVHATGTWGDALTPQTIEAQSTLDRVLPEDVTLDDVVAFDAVDPDMILGSFEPGDPYAERTVHGGASAPACVPVGSGYLPGECSLGVAYSAVQYVHAESITDHGTRGLEVLSAHVCCHHCDQRVAEHCVSGARFDCYSLSASMRPAP